MFARLYENVGIILTCLKHFHHLAFSFFKVPRISWFISYAQACSLYSDFLCYCFLGIKILSQELLQNRPILSLKKCFIFFFSLSDLTICNSTTTGVLYDAWTACPWRAPVFTPFFWCWSVLLIFLVFCVVLCFCDWFVLRLVSPMLPMSLDCSFSIAHSVFSNLYLSLPQSIS